MNKLYNHYHLLLGLDSSWNVDDVTLHIDNKSVEIKLRYSGKTQVCPECGETGKFYDYAPERCWRHLDTMQFETIITATVPRCKCLNCGVKTTSVPWATGRARFTLMFEAFAIDVLQASSSISAACKLISIDWHAADSIIKRAVERGIIRRIDETISYIGIDEKSFHKGHDYIIALTDLLEGKVIDVVKDRTKSATEELFNKLSDPQKNSVEAVAMDFWSPFISESKKAFPDALIVHDRFHIDKYLNEAVDGVRKAENKELKKENKDTLVSTKWWWLQHPENMTDARKLEFDQLLQQELKTGKAWALKNTFREFWNQPSRELAQLFFDDWIAKVEELNLKPLRKVAEMLERHIPEILNFFTHAITNAVSEGLNSKIQSLKAAARGFRSFDGYRARILFFCGKLDMKPNFNH